MSISWETSSGSEEQSDSFDVEEIKRAFRKRLLGDIQHAKATSYQKTGIKRQPGHYQLRNQCHADVTPRVDVYQGKHWDVEIDNSLQRGTKRLTAEAIDKEVSKEQEERSQKENVDLRTAVNALYSVNRELMGIIDKSKEKEKHIHDEQYMETLKTKEAVHDELLRKINKKSIDQATEIERESQVALMSLVKGLETVGALPGRLRNLVSELSDVHHRKSIVHQDIIEAFARREEEAKEAETEYKEAMMSIMDESLNSLKNLFKKHSIQLLSTEEQRRRNVLFKGGLQRPKSLKSSLSFGDVMSELTTTFTAVKEQEELRATKSDRLIFENRERVLQDLRRKYARRWVSTACSAEKTRRIQEQERLLSSEDENIEKHKSLLVQVQREMILQRFAGKWINLPCVAKSEGTAVKDLSEWDQKQKMIRMRVRRKSNVMSEIM